MDIKKENYAKDKSVRLAAVLRRLGIEAVYAAAGLLTGLARLPFGAAPFGFALLCSVGAHAPAVLLGLCLSSLAATDGLVLAGAYLLTAVLRVAFGAMDSSAKREKDGRMTVSELLGGMFSEHLSLRMISASAGAFCVGLYRLYESGFLYYDLFGAILAISAAALGTLLWYGLPALDSRDLRTLPLGLWRTAGFVTLCGVLVYALRPFSPYGISLSALACMLLTLAVTRRRGIPFGALTAIFGGLGVSVTYAPLFVFSAVSFGFLFPVSPLLGSFSAFAVGMSWGIYMDGIASLTSLLPALMAATLLFFVSDKLFFGTAAQKTAESVSEAADTAQDTLSACDADIAVARLNDAACRIKALCEGLSSLSEMLLRSEACMESEVLNGASDGIREDYCADIGEDGVEVKSARTDQTPCRCRRTRDVRAEELAEELRERMALYGHLYTEAERTEAYALDLGVISGYIADIMAENDGEYSIDKELSERASARLAELSDARGVRVCAFGNKRKRIMLASDHRRNLNTHLSALCRELSDVCGFSLYASDVIDVGDGAYTVLYRRPVLDASFAGRKKSSTCEESFCGDSFGVIKDKGRLFAFISDGMGSGRQAAVTSGLCALFLQKLLPVNRADGESVSGTLELLNAFLRHRNGTGEHECSATVDLGVLDLVDGRAGFYKSGAAPTYFFRDGALFKLRSRTAPIGIIKELDSGRINMELLPGDVIVMVSDGVTQGREECPELFELLRSRLMTHSADQLADVILRYAEESGCTDDVSAVVLKIEERLYDRA